MLNRGTCHTLPGGGPGVVMDKASSAIGSEELLAQMGWVRALARGLLTDPGLAEDVAQDTWIRATERPPRAQDGLGLKAWLASVTRTLARQTVRSSRRRTRREQAAAKPIAITEDPSVIERGRIHERVVHAVMQLEEPYRSTVLLRYLDGVSAADIARRQGISPPAVRQRLARAIEKVRIRLDAISGGDREAWSLALLPLAGSFSQTGAIMAKSTAIGWVYVAAGVLVVGAVAVTISSLASEDHRGVRTAVSNPTEGPAEESTPPLPRDLPRPTEARSAVSDPTALKEPLKGAHEDTTVSKLDRILPSFRTDRPDFDGLNAVLAELSRAAVIDPGSIEKDPVTGHAIGRFTVPGSNVVAEFDIDATGKEPSAATGSLRFEWGSRQELGAEFIARDLVLQFGGMTGGRMRGATVVQFHPDTRRKPSGEIVVGWGATYEDRGAHLEPLTARAGSEPGSWVIGHLGSVPAIDQPGTPPTPIHDDWYRRIEPYTR